MLYLIKLPRYRASVCKLVVKGEDLGTDAPLSQERQHHASEKELRRGVQTKASSMNEHDQNVPMSCWCAALISKLDPHCMRGSRQAVRFVSLVHDQVPAVPEKQEPPAERAPDFANDPKRRFKSKTEIRM